VSRSDRILVATGAGALVLAAAAGIMFFAPAPDLAGDELGFGLAPTPDPAVAPPPSGSTAGAPSIIVVDVAGAVARPGIVQLPAGTRIGDALAAAGGYAVDADLDAAAATLNLAQPLSDGEQIRVPRVGEVTVAGGAPSAGAPGGASGGGPSGGGGLVNLNTATPEQLEALPGIGPVTVQKIVAARQERPFTSLEDAQQRGVIHRGQLEGIRELATAG
jgi:competence protein ComEA